jgi:hypothetical protein
MKMKCLRKGVLSLIFMIQENPLHIMYNLLMNLTSATINKCVGTINLLSMCRYNLQTTLKGKDLQKATP